MTRLVELFILPILAALVPLIVGGKWSATRKATSTVLVFAIAFALCYGLTEKRSWRLSGRIVDSRTLRGINGAQITVLRSGKTIESDDNGDFQIELSPGLFDTQRAVVKVSKQKYRPVQKSFEPPIDNVLIEMDETP
ncbi:MAG TPA: hypothetical protein VMT67_08580 [Terriglobales bacterium]|nr:hypothetical protein [Terriglobales bacterium]